MAPILRPEVVQHLESQTRKDWQKWKRLRNAITSAEAANEHVEPCSHPADLSGGERCPCHQWDTYFFKGWTPERTTSYKKAARYEGTDEEFKEAVIRVYGEISRMLDAEDAANAGSTQMPDLAP